MAKEPEEDEEPGDGDRSTGEAEAGAEAPARADAESTDARLARVQAAFERGDYAEVRSLAAPLVAEGGPLGESAADLVQRTKVDPAQVGVLVGCLLFFLYIVWKYVL